MLLTFQHGIRWAFLQPVWAPFRRCLPLLALLHGSPDLADNFDLQQQPQHDGRNDGDLLPQSGDAADTCGPHTKAKATSSHGDGDDDGTLPPQRGVDQGIDEEGFLPPKITEDAGSKCLLLASVNEDQFPTPLVFDPGGQTLFPRMVWLSCGLLYYGINLEVPNNGRDPSMGLILNAIAEMPAYVITAVMVQRCGRRPVLSCAMGMSGVSCLAGTFLGSSKVKMGFAMVAIFGVASSYNVLFVYTVELFPTEVRNIAMGLAVQATQVGAIVAPLSAMLGHVQVWLQKLQDLISQKADRDELLELHKSVYRQKSENSIVPVPAQFLLEIPPQLPSTDGGSFDHETYQQMYKTLMNELDNMNNKMKKLGERSDLNVLITKRLENFNQPAATVQETSQGLDDVKAAINEHADLMMEYADTLLQMESYNVAADVAILWMLDISWLHVKLSCREAVITYFLIPLRGRKYDQWADEPNEAADVDVSDSKSKITQRRTAMRLSYIRKDLLDPG